MKLLRPALTILVVFVLITGGLYPLLMTGIAQLLFPNQANGSLIEQDNKVIGSKWIGQEFTQPQYFWGRPSATTQHPYNAMASGGANLAPSNPQLVASAKVYADRLQKADPQHNPHVPVDLVTHSSSGLDPHISVAGALYQVPRIAKARKVSNEHIIQLINECKQAPWLGIVGEPVVNVLQLNLALDNLTPKGK